MSLLKRIAEKYAIKGDCWIWTGARRSARSRLVEYGAVFYNGRPQQAHRVVYECVKGPIPHGLTLDHLCRNTLCVNPDHLEPVTMRENILRGTGPSAQNAKKDHCKHGHEFTDANTHRRGPGRRVGKRECRECRRAYELRRDRKNFTSGGAVEFKRGAEPWRDWETGVYLCVASSGWHHIESVSGARFIIPSRRILTVLEGGKR